MFPGLIFLDLFLLFRIMFLKLIHVVVGVSILLFFFFFFLVHPEYSLEGLMVKLKLQYLGHLMQRADSLEKSLMLRKIEGRRKGGKRG